MKALEDVEPFEAVDTNIQMKTFRTMICTVNFRNEILNSCEWSQICSAPLVHIMAIDSPDAVGVLLTAASGRLNCFNYATPRSEGFER